MIYHMPTFTSRFGSGTASRSLGARSHFHVNFTSLPPQCRRKHRTQCIIQNRTPRHFLQVVLILIICTPEPKRAHLRQIYWHKVGRILCLPLENIFVQLLDNPPERLIAINRRQTHQKSDNTHTGGYWLLGSYFLECGLSFSCGFLDGATNSPQPKIPKSIRYLDKSQAPQALRISQFLQRHHFTSKSENSKKHLLFGCSNRGLSGAISFELFFGIHKIWWNSRPHLVGLLASFSD